MSNPFTAIAEDKRAGVIDRWLRAGIIADASNGRELVESNDEWGIYSVGEVIALGQVAGLSISVTGIDLGQLLASRIVTDLFDDAWIRKIRTLDDVYMDLVIDYIAIRGWKQDDCIQVRPRLPSGG